MANDSTNNPWFSVSVGLMGLIVGYFVGTSMGGGVAIGGGSPTPTQPTQPTSQAPQQPTQPSGTAPKTGIGPVKGSSSAKVTIVEFTDFQCPYCQRHYQQTYPQLMTNYVDTGKVKYELRNFPLTSIHPNAPAAAEAALCANKQNKFWEMHDVLFEKMTEWNRLPDPAETFKGYASDLGLNASAFSTCISGTEMETQVNKDLADGDAAGVNGTPAFWIIGPNNQSKFVSGAQSYANFSATIDAMLQ